MGPDEISGSIMRAYKEELVGPIHDIINRSIESGTVPVEQKRPEVVPIYEWWEGGSLKLQTGVTNQCSVQDV